MAKPFSAHEFFIEQGGKYSVEVMPHIYTRDIEAGKQKEIENARIIITSQPEAEFTIEVSLPKEALRRLVQVSNKYLRTGEAASFGTE
jgi:hypothetical protein